MHGAHGVMVNTEVCGTSNSGSTPDGHPNLYNNSMNGEESIWNNKNLIETLKQGGVVVMPTDTLYGIVGKAENPDTVECVYSLRKRDLNKPCIILIGNIDEFNKFSITLSEEQKKVINEHWFSNNAVSVILDCVDEKFKYLHRGTQTLAFRLPAQKDLQNLLNETGALVAPSANTQGGDPARNIEEAKNYFGDKVDLYVDGGFITGKASKVLRLYNDGTTTIIRE